MNDEFLHALRRDPPPAFANELKQRLQRQTARRRTRSSAVRVMLAALLIGGVAMATALLLRDRHEPSADDAPIAQAVAQTAPARAGQPADTPRPDRQVASNGSEASPPPTQESEAKDIPVALATSSLARPIAQALVERLSKFGYFAQPRVMTMEADEAFRALCANADFVIASRRIFDGELAQCRKWGIEVVEWKLGFQAVVLTAAPSADPVVLTPRDLFLALARRIPDPAEPSRLIDNPHVTWRDVDARFDSRNIEVLLPSDATTRASFLKLVLEPGCETYFRSQGQTTWRSHDGVCQQLRSDGRYREVDVTNTFITQQLWAEPNWFVVLGYSFYAAHRTELPGTNLEGPAPTLASLSDGTYPAARPVYAYAQRSHLDWNPAARMLAYQLTDESALGARGYLLRHGLVPLEELPRRTQVVRPSFPPTLESLQPEEERAR